MLGGAAAVEKAATDAGVATTVPFTPGRVDTTQDLTDIATFAYRTFNPPPDIKTLPPFGNLDSIY